MIALHDKHVLVTGGASGIGRLLAIGRACGGAAVTILYLDEERADRILKAVRHNDPVVQMPLMVSTLPVMRLLPVWAFDQLADFFGLNNAMDAFTGRTPARDESATA